MIFVLFTHRGCVVILLFHFKLLGAHKNDNDDDSSVSTIDFYAFNNVMMR